MVELHVHSEYSNLRTTDSINAINKLIPKALEKGLSGICLTDHESLSGHIKMLQQAKKYRESNPDFKVMLGNEIYLIPEEAYKNIDKFFHFILIAKDLKGHEQLRKLSSLAWERSYRFKGQERVPTFYSDFEKVFNGDKGHIIASTACLGGFYSMAILNKYYEKLMPFIEWGQNTFGKENFFIELQPARSEEQINVNKISYRLSEEKNIPCIITNDVHYYFKEDATIHTAYLNSKDEEREVAAFYENTYFKTEQEMISLMEDYLPLEFIEGCFKNTEKIAAMCENYDLSAPTKVPQRSIPFFALKGLFSPFYDKYEYINNFATSGYEQDRFLLHMIEIGFEKKGEPFTEENLARIDIELQQIWEISKKLDERLSSYYNLTQELIDIMWDDKKGNSLVGVARGSVTGFYICYLMDITQVNPIKWNLPWWRHLHASRPELPDVDVDSEAGKRKQIIEAIRQHYGQNRVLNIATFKTEGTKASLITACRGLNIDNDIAQELSDMIPVERGKSWSLRDCLQGNEELERQPLGNFIKKVESIPKLVETALGIEGLICGRSIHASGTYIYNDHYIHQSSLMRAPNGVPTTCWSMEDNDTTGALKEDLLTVEGLDKIRMSLDFLLEDGKIEWKGSLRETYNAYLYPSVLDYDNPEMWNALGHNKIIDVFQFDTAVSINCLQKIKPTNLKEMAMANSLMRLSAYNGEMPMDKYARYKQNPELWEGEMTHFGLNEEEKGVLRKHLGPMFGIAAEQEDIMELSMDPKISNFTVAQANILRKAVAKKKADVLAKAKGLFFEEGLKAGTRKEFLIYIWENCIMPQSGYGFSKNHTLPYSVIGLQEMNIYSRYGEVYWNAACLSVNASASDENESSGTTNYGKIAASISKMQKHGVKVSLPDINTAKFGFKPDVQNNSILFGIKGMNGVGDEVANLIIQKRPYSSFEDFLIKHEYSLPNVSVINLIKGGCFDNIEKKSREEIMRDYVKIMVLKMNPPITKLTMANFNELVEYGLYNQKTYPLVASHYSFYKYVTQKIFQRGYASQDFKVCYIDEKAEPYFKQHCMPMMTIGKEYFIKDDAILVLESRFNSWYNKAIAPFKESIKHNESLLKRFNEHRFTNAANDLWTKYCLGSIPKWEMDSLSFYYTDHELNSVDPIKAGIADFFKLSPMPAINYTKPTRRGEYTQYFIYKIIGTVLDKDKIKKTITLLTPSGVVTVKFYSDLFVEYNKQISKVNTDGTKTVVDKSWFSRGTKLQILGFRRDDQFIPRRYNDVVYKHLIAKISNVKPNGEMDLVTERPSGLEEEDEGEKNQMQS